MAKEKDDKMSNVINVTFNTSAQTEADHIDIELDQMIAELQGQLAAEGIFDDEHIWDLFAYDSPKDVEHSRNEYRRLLIGAGCDELEIARELRRLFPEYYDKK